MTLKESVCANGKGKEAGTTVIFHGVTLGASYSYHVALSIKFFFLKQQRGILSFLR